MPFARARRMKLGLGPLPLLVGVIVLLTTSPSRASPRSSWSNTQAAQEDALADGDIDPDDIATQSPLTALSGVGGKTVLGGPSDSTWVSLLGFTRRTFEDRQEIGG